MSETKDLSAFHGKIAWPERKKLIEEHFPKATSLNWKSAFDRDPDLMARILRDILKLDTPRAGRSGPRPAVDYEQGAAALRQMMGQDYSILPFAEALEALLAHRTLSLRGLQARTNISKSQLHRLLKGEVEPSVAEMRDIARAFKKHPSYFLEYRNGYVLAALGERLSRLPEASINFYQKISRAE